MMEVVLNIKIPDSWMENIKNKYHANIKFLDCMPVGKSGGRGLIEIDATDSDIDKIIEDLKRHEAVCKVDISPSPDGGVLSSIVTTRCVACQALTGSECFLTAAILTDDGRVEWRLITGEDGSLLDLINKLEKLGCKVELKRSQRLSKRAILTKRQEQIIQIAFEKGYFDVPKKITIDKLAKIFNVSPSTLAEILQRGEKKIMKQYFNRI
jgi:predicted DNA binding protein